MEFFSKVRTLENAFRVFSIPISYKDLFILAGALLQTFYE